MPQPSAHLGFSGTALMGWFPGVERIPRRLRYRLVFLLVGNLALLISISALLKPGASFAEVILTSGPNVAPILIAGIGLTGVIYTGAIDLSIASIMAVSGTAFGICVQQGTGPLFAYFVCTGTAWALSILNGVAINRLRVPAIIFTLAGLAFYRGVALILAELALPNFGGFISVQDETYHGPGKRFAGWIMVVTLGGALLWEAYAKTPRRWLALGNSEEACRLLGVNPPRIVLSAFIVSGLFLGLATLIYVTRLQVIEPARVALGFELQVIGAVVLGGTNIFGGEGSFLGTLLGAFFLYFTSQLLIYAEVNPYLQDAITGGIIISVIGFDCAIHRSRKLLEELA
jgi:ribose transport system permease protein